MARIKQTSQFKPASNLKKKLLTKRHSIGGYKNNSPNSSLRFSTQNIETRSSLPASLIEKFFVNEPLLPVPNLLKKNFKARKTCVPNGLLVGLKQKQKESPVRPTTRSSSSIADSTIYSQSFNLNFTNSIENRSSKKVPRKSKPKRIVSTDTDELIRRGKPGTQALKEILFHQSKTDFLIPRLPFQRVVHDICNNCFTQKYRFQLFAMEVLQTAAEKFVMELFDKANLFAIHAKRQTIFVTDIKLAEALSS